MERKPKKSKKDEVFEVLKSRKNEARILLKKCFENPIFSLVPFEIWRDIVCEAEIDVIGRISQTCWGFRELVDNLRELLLEYALKYRREDKIEKARNLILRCAEIGNSRAMFHVGYAYWYAGWGFLTCFEKAAEWFKKSAELGNAVAIAYYAYCLLIGFGVEKNEELGKVWAKKALSSKDSLALGFCYFFGLISRSFGKAFWHFKVSAEEGDECGQSWLGTCYENGHGVKKDEREAFLWHLKSAEQGFASAQHDVGRFYRDGRACEKNEDLARMWFQKAKNQSIA